MFVPHLQDSIWGGGVQRSNFTIPLTKTVSKELLDAFDDERRLLYVAMTRAKIELYFSSSETSTESRALIPTRLFDSIRPETITDVQTTKEEEIFNPIDALASTSTQRQISAGLIKDLFATRGFSATSLNNYLRNPWDYVYRNILRIPETQSIQMQFGTAVHNVLEFVTRQHTKNAGVMPTATQIKTVLEQELGRLPLSQNDFVRLHEKGLAVLLPYIEQLAKTLPAQTKEEVNLRVLLPTGIADLPELPLSGKLDRLDLAPDGRAVRIIDYKTGKPKTRNVIEGKTATSPGDYKRQLVFYSLLLSLYDDDRYQCRDSLLSFVEPDAKGFLHEEQFIITDQEVELLRQEIIAAVSSMVAGDWINDPTLRKESTYAHLINLL